MNIKNLKEYQKKSLLASILKLEYKESILRVTKKSNNTRILKNTVEFKKELIQEFLVEYKLSMNYMNNIENLKSELIKNIDNLDFIKDLNLNSY